MKILVFHQFYTKLDEAGISRFSLFAPYWKQARYETTVIAGRLNYMTGKCGAGGRALWSRETDGSVELIRAWSSSIGYRTFLGRLLSYGTYLFSAFLAGMFVKKPSVIVASSPPIFIGLLAYAVSRLRRVPFILEVRDLWPDEIVELGGLTNKHLIRASYRLERFLYKKARRIVVNSPGLKAFLMQNKALPEEKIGVVPNPVEFSMLRGKSRDGFSIRQRLGWGKKLVVLYSGSHSMVYDFDTLLDVAGELQKEDVPFHFVFLGDGRQKLHMQNRVSHEDIKNVQFLDPVPKDEVAGYISAADICIVSLGKMGLLRYVYATKVLDYMSMKKPVIVAMEGVTGDLVCRHAKCGICVSPGDKEKMKQALLRLAKSESGRSLLGEQGYIFLKEHFSAEALAKRYLQYL